MRLMFITLRKGDKTRELARWWGKPREIPGAVMGVLAPERRLIAI
jgi:hypothetical protein